MAGTLAPSAGGIAAADTRTQVLSVARELFVAQGFAATTTRELADRLGFTKAALYYHFRTKDDLLAALVEPIIAQLRRLVADSPLRRSAAARRALLAAYIDIAASDLDLVRVLTQDPSAARRPVTAEHAAHYQRMLHLLCGHEQPDTTERARARAALGAIREALIRAEEDEDPETLRAAALEAACGALGLPARGTPRT